RGGAHIRRVIHPVAAMLRAAPVTLTFVRAHAHDATAGLVPLIRHHLPAPAMLGCLPNRAEDAALAILPGHGYAAAGLVRGHDDFAMLGEGLQPQPKLLRAGGQHQANVTLVLR